MHRFLPFLLCAGLAPSVASSLGAQSNFIEMATSAFTSRDALGTASGEVLHEFPPTSLRGVGAVRLRCAATHIRALIQDQAPQSGEALRFVIRRATATGIPDTSAAGLLYRSALVQLPPSQQTTPVAFIITHALPASLVLPCDRTVFAGCELPAAPSWTRDGLGVHIEARVRTEARPGAPFLVWTVLGGVATRSTTALGARISFASPTPALTPLVRNQRSGAHLAGYYPDTARLHGLTLRLDDRLVPNGTAVFAVNTGARLTVGLPFFARGALWLRPGGALVIGATTMRAGTASLVVTNRIPPILRLSALRFQAFSITTNGQISGSNEVVVRP